MKITLAISVLMLTGCSMMQPRMDIADLNAFQIDCANKDAQLRFLEKQLTTPNDRLLAGLDFSENGRAIVSREYDAAAKRAMWQLRTQCPNDKQPLSANYVATK